jgi:hypothetical protein
VNRKLHKMPDASYARGRASVMDSVFGDGEEDENGAADLAATPFTWLIGGAMGIRTPDLFHAMDACSV